MHIVYTYLYTYLHIYIHSYISIYILTYLCTFLHIYRHQDVHSRLAEDTCIHAQYVYTSTHILTYRIHIYIDNLSRLDEDTYIHVRTHTYYTPTISVYIHIHGHTYVSIHILTYFPAKLRTHTCMRTHAQYTHTRTTHTQSLCFTPTSHQTQLLSVRQRSHVPFGGKNGLWFEPKIRTPIYTHIKWPSSTFHACIFLKVNNISLLYQSKGEHPHQDINMHSIRLE